jgi:hypothetical protein
VTGKLELAFKGSFEVRHCNKEGTCNRSDLPGTPPCVNRYGKPFGNQGKVAIVNDEQDAELDPSLLTNELIV